MFLEHDGRWNSRAPSVGRSGQFSQHLGEMVEDPEVPCSLAHGEPGGRDVLLQPVSRGRAWPSDPRRRTRDRRDTRWRRDRTPRQEDRPGCPRRSQFSRHVTPPWMSSRKARAYSGFSSTLRSERLNTGRNASIRDASSARASPRSSPPATASTAASGSVGSSRTPSLSASHISASAPGRSSGKGRRPRLSRRRQPDHRRRKRWPGRRGRHLTGPWSRTVRRPEPQPPRSTARAIERRPNCAEGERP